jgi:hypothetical protein
VGKSTYPAPINPDVDPDLDPDLTDPDQTEQLPDPDQPGTVQPVQNPPPPE